MGSFFCSTNPAERAVLATRSETFRARASSSRVQEHGARSAECSRCDNRGGIPPNRFSDTYAQKLFYAQTFSLLEMRSLISAKSPEK